MSGSPTRRRALAAIGAIASLPLAACAQAPSMEGWPMPTNAKPSVTLLHLLRRTPFFVGLDDTQLQWAIDHSREWSVPAGSEISAQTPGPDHVWILLDGGWQVDRGGRVERAGNADPAKWFGGAELHALGPPGRLVATSASYVMVMRWSDLQTLRARNPPIDKQLQDGLRHYRETRR